MSPLVVVIIVKPSILGPGSMLGKYDSHFAFTQFQRFLVDEALLIYKQHQAQLTASTTMDNPAHAQALVTVAQTLYAQALTTHW